MFFVTDMSSRRGDRFLHLLGAVPRAATALHLRPGLALLQRDQRMDVLRNRHLVLLLVHAQPDPVQRHVESVQDGVQGNPVHGQHQEDHHGEEVDLQVHEGVSIRGCEERQRGDVTAGASGER